MYICGKINKYFMKQIIVCLLLLLCTPKTSSQIICDDIIFNRVDSLIHEQNEEKNSSEEYYISSINDLTLLLNKRDSLQQWDCDNFLKTAYYLAFCNFKLHRANDAKFIIDNALLKCTNIWEYCIYAKKMYKLLLDIYDLLGCSPNIMEQIHNEIQMIAINIYALDPHNQDGDDIRNKFMYWHNKDSYFGSRDYFQVAFCKAAYLRGIKEYEEAIRLNEIIRKNLNVADADRSTIYDSLLQMYAETSNKDSIESLLSEIYTYSNKYSLMKNIFTKCMVVANILFKKGDYQLSQMYYERVNNYLNQNKDVDDWISKKKAVLSWLTWNYKPLGKYEEVFSCCKEYERLSETLDYEEMCFVKYQEGDALLELEKYDQAISVLYDLVISAKEQGQEKSEEYVRGYHLLGICYSKIEQGAKSIDCLTTALETYISINMDDESILANLYHYLGMEYHKQNQSEKALSYLELSAAIQNKIYGAANENTKQLIEKCKNTNLK